MLVDYLIKFAIRFSDKEIRAISAQSMLGEMGEMGETATRDEVKIR